MSKKCLTLIDCPFSKHCKWANIPPNEARGFFQPPHVGENCHNYELTQTAYDRHKDVMAAMQRGFITMSMIPYILIAVFGATSALFFHLYRSTADVYAQYKANVLAEQERAKRESDKITADVSQAWSDALDHYRNNPRIVRVRDNNCEVPVPRAANEPDDTSATHTISAEQCEAHLNDGIKDATQLIWLIEWVKKTHEVTK
jgi:hypothetical protein